MAETVVTAVIAGGAAIGCSLVTYFTTMKVHKSQIAQYENDKVKREMELELLRGQRDKQEADLTKTKVETHLLKTADLKITREKLSKAISIFANGVFNAGINREQPVAMYVALTRTRRELQTNGLLALPDSESASIINTLYHIIVKKQDEVSIQFPWILKAIDEQEDKTKSESKTVLYDVDQNFGANDTYFPAVHCMMELRSVVDPLVEDLRNRLREIDKQLQITQV